MTPAQALTVTAGAALLIVASSRRGSFGLVEAAPDDFIGGFDVMAIVDKGETIINRIAEQAALISAPPPAADATDAFGVPLADIAARNCSAFLYALRQAEGTETAGDAYRVCYGYRHTVQDLSEHPAVSGEWKGETLPDAMCSAAGFGPGCVSTAAGAYQLIRPTWLRMRDALGLVDFGQASQDAAALELVRRRGAIEDVKAGRFAAAFSKCRNEWASLPGNYAQQGQRSADQLALWVTQAGGITA